MTTKAGKAWHAKMERAKKAKSARLGGRSKAKRAERGFGINDHGKRVVVWEPRRPATKAARTRVAKMEEKRAEARKKASAKAKKKRGKKR